MIEQKEYYDRKKAEEMAPAKELYDAMSSVIKKQYPEQWKELFPQQWKELFPQQWKELFPQWIPVNKELPKKAGEYLVTVGGEATFPDVDTAWFYHGHWIHRYNQCTVKVIAWMPLPEPYMGTRSDTSDRRKD